MPWYAYPWPAAAYEVWLKVVKASYYITFLTNPWVHWIMCLILNTQVTPLFSELETLESDLVDTLKDHIRLVQFGYEGDVERMDSFLRSVLVLTWMCALAMTQFRLCKNYTTFLTKSYDLIIRYHAALVSVKVYMLKPEELHFWRKKPCLQHPKLLLEWSSCIICWSTVREAFCAILRIEIRGEKI